MTTSPSSRGGSQMRAIFYMCLATVLLFPLLNATVKFLGEGFTVWQIIWVRSILHLAVMLALCAPGYGLVRVFKTSKPVLQLTRAGLQTGAMYCFMAALISLPLATVTSITFTAAFMVVMLSIPMLGERVGIRRWAAVLVGFIGAIVIIRPGSDIEVLPALLALGAALCYAFFQILTRKLAPHDDTRVTAVYTVLVTLVVATAIAPFDMDWPSDTNTWLLFAALGLIGGISHYFLIKAYETGEASMLSPFDYGQLVGATLLGYFIWGDFPDGWTWLGIAIIICSGIYIAHREARRKPL
ncbi:MAG: DMT family transporter [Rhodospirillaceae bacterium]|nr:DMT family transporter [Rhodospirillaceae bacterium]MBT4428628.1 DMT family transporter [Rhodospirillaceae bacterium]MBT5040476.1 DMT family transporter [Rhodospirillaceae bacterium]MBT5675266.1 DMT family transporter [Rhodospirillaceae bacterium]MBT5778719.1 DMT family transporter [Rhodospirillaceae bacterium]